MPADSKKAAERTDRLSNDVINYLASELPTGDVQQARSIADALHSAAMRYDRHRERRDEWWQYRRRTKSLESIVKTTLSLSLALAQLDSISREDLLSRRDPQEIDDLAGSLLRLASDMGQLALKVQKNGKPRDLAEERWIMEVADIYESNFGRTAKVSGSGGGPTNQRGKFYRLLELHRPTKLKRFGKLSLRQIDRVLKLHRSR